MRFKVYREAVLAARTEGDVRRIIQEAMADLSSAELASMPGECREIVRDSDVQSAAVLLLHCDLKHRGEREIGELIRQTAELYAWASVRISQLEHTRPSSSDD